MHRLQDTRRDPGTPDSLSTPGQAPTEAANRPAGRFAPSPTGDLHFGSLLAALASYCEARVRNGLWHLRIDDIDEPRSVAGSADAIQHTLEYFGFEWDGPVIWQSTHIERYQDALAALADAQRVFACNCSRRSLPSGAVYPGTCRNKRLPVSETRRYRVADHAIRMHLQGDVQFHDAIQGTQQFDLARDVGDIVVWRRDGLVSYSLACAVDDADGVSQVVRGADLQESTGAQIGIMNALGLTPPDYAHIPVAIDNNGDKLSKHSKAAAISKSDPLLLLMQAWQFLGQDQFAADTLAQFWQNAMRLWDITKVPGKPVQVT